MKYETWNLDGKMKFGQMKIKYIIKGIRDVKQNVKYETERLNMEHGRNVEVNE